MVCLNVPSHRALVVMTLVFGLLNSSVVCAGQPQVVELWSSVVAKFKSHAHSMLQHLQSEAKDGSNDQIFQSRLALKLPVDSDSHISFDLDDMLSINLDQYVNRSEALKLVVDAKGVDLSARAGQGNITLSYERSMSRYFSTAGVEVGEGVMLSFSRLW